MKLGITSYAFRYLLQDSMHAPPLKKVVELTRSHGLERLQLCENAQPCALGMDDWRALIRWAGDEGLEIELGCKTLNIETLAKHLERAAETLSKTLRIVLEEDGEPPPTRGRLEMFLEQGEPMLRTAGVRLAIENYFAIPSQVLAELVNSYPASSMGFCVDTANSLRKFEPALYVLKLLGPRAFCYHVKDYRVMGDNVGFKVEGAPLGTGDLALDEFLDAVLARDPSPEFFLENWVPVSGRREADIDADARWLQESLGNFRERLRLREK